MYYNATVECFRMEAFGVHRQEALTRQAVCHASPLAYSVGPHGFLKEASTCRIETGPNIALQNPLWCMLPSENIEALLDGIRGRTLGAKAIGIRIVQSLRDGIQGEQV